MSINELDRKCKSEKFIKAAKEARVWLAVSLILYVSLHFVLPVLMIRVPAIGGVFILLFGIFGKQGYRVPQLLIAALSAYSVFKGCRVVGSNDWKIPFWLVGGFCLSPIIVLIMLVIISTEIPNHKVQM